MPRLNNPKPNVEKPAPVTLPPMFVRYREELERELRCTIPRHKLLLYSMLEYHMGWRNEQGDLLTSPVSQGKALRPVLCLFAHEALHGDWTKALPAAAALELIHSFSLIHDDIQDGDTERRHRPTVWSIWGQPQALTAGNAMRALADMTTGRLIERGFPEEKVLRCSHLLTEGYLDMIEGQYLDLSFEGRLDIALQDYLSMISRKTAALIRCSMEVGALLASDHERYIRAFGRSGSFLGLAFQIRDDVLGIWGDENTTGKSVGNDVRRKKKSFPIVFALEKASGGSKEVLVNIYNKPFVSEQDVELVMGILDELGAQDYAHQMTVSNATRALEELEKVSIASWARREIEELAEFLAARNY